MQRIQRPPMSAEQLAQIIIPQGYLDVYWNNGSVFGRINSSWFELEDMSIRPSLELLTGTPNIRIHSAFLFTEDGHTELKEGFEQNKWSDYAQNRVALQFIVNAFCSCKRCRQNP